MSRIGPVTFTLGSLCSSPSAAYTLKSSGTSPGMAVTLTVSNASRTQTANTSVVSTSVTFTIIDSLSRPTTIVIGAIGTSSASPLPLPDSSSVSWIYGGTGQLTFLIYAPGSDAPDLSLIRTGYVAGILTALSTTPSAQYTVSVTAPQMGSVAVPALSNNRTLATSYPASPDFRGFQLVYSAPGAIIPVLIPLSALPFHGADGTVIECHITSSSSGEFIGTGLIITVTPS